MDTPHTIHIAGAMPRIGTTTVALQMVQFCIKYGYKACYVEFSKQNYIWAISKLYEGVTNDRAKARTIYNGIDMYGADRIDALLNGNVEKYDFIICDFGSVSDKNFDLQRFAGGDCGVLVCGNKANEINQTDEAISNQDLADAIAAYVFNFTDPADQNDIKSMMLGCEDRTCFMPYIPDPFGNTGETQIVTEFFQEVMDLLMRTINDDSAEE